MTGPGGVDDNVKKVAGVGVAPGSFRPLPGAGDPALRALVGHLDGADLLPHVRAVVEAFGHRMRPPRDRRDRPRHRPRPAPDALARRNRLRAVVLRLGAAWAERRPRDVTRALQALADVCLGPGWTVSPARPPDGTPLEQLRAFLVTATPAALLAKLRQLVTRGRDVRARSTIIVLLAQRYGFRLAPPATGAPGAPRRGPVVPRGVFDRRVRRLILADAAAYGPLWTPEDRAASRADLGAALQGLVDVCLPGHRVVEPASVVARRHAGRVLRLRRNAAIRIRVLAGRAHARAMIAPRPGEREAAYLDRLADVRRPSPRLRRRRNIWSTWEVMAVPPMAGAVNPCAPSAAWFRDAAATAWQHAQLERSVNLLAGELAEWIAAYMTGLTSGQVHEAVYRAWTTRKRRRSAAPRPGEQPKTPRATT